MSKLKIDREKLEEIGYVAAATATDILKDVFLVMLGALLTFLWVTTDTDEEA